MSTTTTASSTVICVWPDGVWCEESEVHEYTHRSDDYHRIVVPDTAVQDYEYIANHWLRYGQYQFD